MKKTVSMLVVASSFICLTLLAMAQDKEKQSPPQPARKIPGITVDDAFPRGCVDCHINYPQMNVDARFSSLMKGWTTKVEPALLARAQAAAPRGVTLKGKHPDVAFALKNIPASCMTCHSKKSTLAPPFAQMVHGIHLTGGEENHFLTVFQGECTHCHKLDRKTGLWLLPSSPEP
ncbi:MAG TPA: hypothetical protein VFV34_20985 [Blastocatellia bacterium]|nr:hypothetical protein [Blastocatellia bacterium]